MKKDSIVAVVAMLLLVSTFLCACSPSQVQNENSSSTDTESYETDPASEFVTLVRNEEAQFCITYAESVYKRSAEYAAQELKKKSGATFEVFDIENKPSTLRVIYIGSDYKDIFPDSSEQMTYNGYGTFYHEGDIYICGARDETVDQAVRKFFASLSKDKCVLENDDGEQIFVVHEDSFQIFTPVYSVKNATLLSVSAWKYSIVYSDSASYTTRVMVQSLYETVGAKTGCMLKLVTDAAEPADYEIVIGKTNRKDMPQLDSDKYTIVSDDTKVYVNFGSFPAAEAALSRLNDLWGSNEINISETAENSLHVAKNEECIRIMTSNVLFSNSDNTGLGWLERSQMLSDIYLDFLPDFIGLQEAGGDIGDAISERLSQKYTRISQMPKGYTPILYRHDIWSIAKDNDGNELKKYEVFKGDGCWAYEWVIFEHIRTGELILVMNLHFQPSQHSAGKHKYRAESMDLVNAELKRLDLLYPDMPIAVTGDFNTTASYVSQTGEGWTDIVGDTPFDCAAKMTEDNDDPKLNKIDHVVVDPSRVKVERHVIISYASMQKSSDHKPVYVDLTLNKK